MPTLELTHQHLAKLQRLNCVFHMHPDMKILESAKTLFSEAHYFRLFPAKLVVTRQMIPTGQRALLSSSKNSDYKI